MDFYHLLKILVHMQLKLLKIWAISIGKRLLIVLKKYFITSISKSPKEFHSKEFHPKESHSTTDVGEIKMPKERYISPEKKLLMNYKITIIVK